MAHYRLVAKGGGGGGGVSDLQGAYDGGTTIAISGGVPVDVQYDSIGASYATWEAGVLLSNNTDATGATVQHTPAVQLRGHGWSGTADVDVDWSIKGFVNYTGTSAPEGALAFGWRKDSGVWTQELRIGAVATSSYSSIRAAIASGDLGIRGTAGNNGRLMCGDESAGDWAIFGREMTVTESGLGTLDGIWQLNNGAGASREMAFINGYNAPPSSGRAFTFCHASNGASAPAEVLLSAGYANDAFAYVPLFQVQSNSSANDNLLLGYGGPSDGGSWLVLYRTYAGNRTHSSIQIGPDDSGTNVGYPNPTPAYYVSGTAFQDSPMLFRQHAMRDIVGNTAFSLNWSLPAKSADPTNNFRHTAFEYRATGNQSRAVGHFSMHGDLMCNGRYNQQSMTFASKTEVLTVAAAASTDTTITAPGRSVILGVSVRVTGAIPTATTFDVGTATTPTLFASGVSTADTTTDPGTDGVPVVNTSSSGQAVRITPNLTPADNSGRIRVTIHYYEITPPTS